MILSVEVEVELGLLRTREVRCNGCGSGEQKTTFPLSTVNKSSLVMGAGQSYLGEFCCDTDDRKQKWPERVRPNKNIIERADPEFAFKEWQVHEAEDRKLDRGAGSNHSETSMLVNAARNERTPAAGLAQKRLGLSRRDREIEEFSRASSVARSGLHSSAEVAQSRKNTKLPNFKRTASDSGNSKRDLDNFQRTTSDPGHGGNHKIKNDAGFDRDLERLVRNSTSVAVHSVNRSNLFTM